MQTHLPNAWTKEEQIRKSTQCNKVAFQIKGTLNSKMRPKVKQELILVLKVFGEFKVQISFDPNPRPQEMT